jgi:hypothetical protein
MIIESKAGAGFRPRPLPFEPSFYDPYTPIPFGAGKSLQLSGGARQSQRLRKSEIYASIRRLLGETGCKNVTLRKIAGDSGYAVQTIYNLVGPRDDAISEAISEYKLFVGFVSASDPKDPRALPLAISAWFHNVSMEPDLARQSHLIYFTDSRSIYYRFRDRQISAMRDMLLQQKNCGIIKPGIDTNALAEHLVLYVCSNWLDWSDGGFPLETLRHKICSGYASILADKISPQYIGIISDGLASVAAGNQQILLSGE